MLGGESTEMASSVLSSSRRSEARVNRASILSSNLGKADEKQAR